VKAYLLLILFTFSCSTPKEKSFSMVPNHGTTPITFGKVSQSLLILLNIMEGGDLVESSGIVMTAHALSLFYGTPYREKDKNEEEILLKFCSKEFKVTGIEKCCETIYKDIISQSKTILPNYHKLVSFKKEAVDLENTILSMLEGGTFKGAKLKLLNMPVIQFGTSRVSLPPLKKGSLSYMRRVPGGLQFTIKDGMVTSGDFFKTKISNEDPFIPLFLRGASFNNHQEISIMASKSEKAKPIVKILALARSKGVSHIVIWGISENITSGIKVKLVFNHSPDNSIKGDSYKKWETLVSDLGKLAISGKPPLLALNKPLEIKNKPNLPDPKFNNKFNVPEFTNIPEFTNELLHGVHFKKMK
jgi:hypothetical protein